MKFEYRQVAIRVQEPGPLGSLSGRFDTDLTPLMNYDLNSMGAEGWEMVSSIPVVVSGSTWQVVHTFKRHLVDSGPQG